MISCVFMVVTLTVLRTLRLSNHQSLVPGENFEIMGNNLVEKLMRSKTTRDDKSLSFRLMVIDQCCCVRKPDWLSVGWRLVSGQAEYARDYLLP